MKDKKYVVSRDKIYVGQVIRTSSIYRFVSDKDNAQKANIHIGTWKYYRSMLFVPDKNDLADDLLYNSPKYPIVNITDDDILLKLDANSIIIKDACNLEKLLKYFNYDEKLTYEEIKRIHKMFFNNKFISNYCELFGKREIKPEDYKYYKNGIEITDPKELKRILIKEKQRIKKEHKSYTDLSESVLPRGYWSVLNNNSNNSLMDVIKGYEKRVDVFSPYNHEYKIKKLKTT